MIERMNFMLTIRFLVATGLERWKGREEAWRNCSLFTPGSLSFHSHHKIAPLTPVRLERQS
jgi:hypothetical protein